MIDRRKFFAAATAAVVGGPLLPRDNRGIKRCETWHVFAVSVDAIFVLDEALDAYWIFPYDPAVPGSYEAALDQIDRMYGYLAADHRVRIIAGPTT